MCLGQTIGLSKPQRFRSHRRSLTDRLGQRSLTLGTLEGHPEAGRITFGAYRNDDGDVVFHIRSRARSSTLFNYVGFKSADVTELARGWVDGSIPNNGIVLQEPAVHSHLFWSSEAGLSSRPALGLCYVNGPGAHRGGALVAGGITSDSPGHHFIGTLGESPGGNRVSTSQNHRFIGGVVGGTQE